MRDVAILVTTFERPFMCLKCVKSIRRYYPDIRILVSDNGKRRLWFKYLLKKLFSIDYLKLPFDSGLSKSRNEALKRLAEKYVVICDDDFAFTEETRLENFRKILEARKDIGLVAGLLRYGDKVEWFTNRIEIRGNFYQIASIKNSDWLEENKIKFHYSDFVYNFFMMRNVPDFRWDEDYKIGKEHIDFFLNIKLQKKWRVAFTPTIIANHYYRCPTGQYEKYRHRIDSFKLFREKTDYRCGFSEVMPFVYDKIEDRIMPYPEYVWKREIKK